MIRFIYFSILIIWSCTGTGTKNYSPDEEAIRYGRALSNQSIAAKDTMSIADQWMENFLIITSRGNQVEGKELNRKLFANEFKTKQGVNYVRTPKSVEVMEEWDVASETGTWEGTWIDDGGSVEIGGTYYAKWHKVDGKWLIRVEIFTPAKCIGAKYCKSKPV